MFRRTILQRGKSSLYTPSRTFGSTRFLQEVKYVRFRRPGEPPQRPGTQHPLNFGNWDPRVRIVTLIGGLGTIYYVSHLEQVEETGRWRFMNTSQKTEAAIGDLSREEIYRDFKGQILPPNHPVSRHVRRVVSRILTASNLGVVQGEQTANTSPFGFGGVGGFGGFSTPDSSFGASTHPSEAYGPQKEWDVVVVADRKTINAMATPGVIVVFTGILPVCRDEEGLAAVLAHEIGHVVARHTAERISSQTIWIGISLLLQTLGLDAFISHSLTTYALALPNSRTQEREADMIGLRLMSRACYNPGAAPAMFARLGQIEKSVASRSSLEFLQTHPASENRVKYLEKALPEAYQIVEANPECAQVRQQLNAFRETAQGIRVDDIPSMKPF
ncbi:peptidase family M48-domain-containing protein [Ephemerocybe angulata]|uniref:Peptidase family M48-domain-containing protein n=1 Tax=Ephemerocybe angulata TaxID=980116 RepID=A0A8H6HV09_9AGAR|nr:peptidase family M48-domain-containing protein [Tulosesus angulatus]